MTPQDLKQIDSLIVKRLKNFATKDDLKSFPTKDDVQSIVKGELKGYATKNDVRSIVKDELREYVTKNDVRSIVKSEFKGYATKDDLNSMKKEMLLKIDESAAYIIDVIDKHKADKEEVKQLEKRVDRIEKLTFSPD